MPEAAVHVGSGKVRELYALDADRLLLVASDRISTFDVVLPTEIPDKGRVLTGLSGFWFARTRGICANHLLAVRDDGRSMECRRLEMLPIECVVRGYLVGSGWKDYRATGSVCGHELPAGLEEASRLPKPIFTPATKATTGHDENIDRDSALELMDASRFDEVERVSLALYDFAADYALERGIIIADTKFEFGVDDEGRLGLADEAFTPDSSRFWPADEYRPGGAQRSFDKQFVRDYCESVGWAKTPPGPELPEDVVTGTRARYLEAFEQLTGLAFDDYAADPEVLRRGERPCSCDPRTGSSIHRGRRSTRRCGSSASPSGTRASAGSWSSSSRRRTRAPPAKRWSVCARNSLQTHSSSRTRSSSTKTAPRDLAAAADRRPAIPRFQRRPRRSLGPRSA